MTMIDVKDKFRLLTFCLSIFAIIASIVICIGNNNPKYNNLWILPAVTGSVIFLSYLVGRKVIVNIPLLLFYALFYLRNVISVFILYLSDYASFFKEITSDGIDNAVFLMSFETIIVFSFCLVKSIKTKYSSQLIIRHPKYTKHKNVTIALVAIVGMLALFNPSFLDDYVSIFTADNIRTFQDFDDYRGPVYSLFAVLMPIAYLSVALLLLSNYLHHKTPQFLILAITCIPFLFMNGSDAFNIICFLALCLTALRFKLLSQSSFNIFVGVGVSLAIFYVGITIVEGAFGAESKNGWEKISEMLQAYQPGVTNVAGVFQMRDHDKLITLFFDLFSTIPFRGSIFGVANEQKLVTLFTDDNNANAQIIPCIGQLYYYFWYVSLLVEMLYVYFAYRTYKKSLECNDPYTYFTLILLVLYLVLTPTTYNTTIFLARYFSMILPMYLLYKIVNKKELNKQSIEQKVALLKNKYN